MSQQDLPEWSFSRREMIRLSTLLGGGLIFGCKPRQGSDVSSVGGEAGDTPLNSFIHISPSGEIVLYIPKSEMGQGIMTGLATIVAEELGIAPDQVIVKHGFGDKAFYNDALPIIGAATKIGLGLQLTGGSTSLASSFKPMRLAAAAARENLVAAAIATKGGSANEWEIKGDQIVRVNAPGTAVKLSQLIGTAQGIPLKTDPILKSASAFRYIGKTVPRVDCLDKITGKAIFGIDVKIDGMVHATVLHPPTIGGKLLQFNRNAIKDIPGIIDVFEIKSGLAIVANRTWDAQRAYQIYADNVGGTSVQWDAGKNAGFQSADLSTAQFFENNSIGWKDVIGKGAVTDRSWNASKQRALSFYYTPFVPHATMEPMNCTVHITGGRCKIWAPTQYPSGAQEIAKSITKLPLSAIDVTITMMGGGFGRRLYQDFVGEAVEIAVKVNRPVKLLWTRVEDMKNDYYRPASGHRMRGGVDALGNPTCWEHKLSTQSLYTQFASDWTRDFLPGFTPNTIKALAGRTAGLAARKGIVPDDFASEGADTLPYEVGDFYLGHHQLETPVRVGFWRSVGHSNTGFVVESFVDEMAALGKRDPAEFRMSLLRNSPRNTAVLQLAMQKANYKGKQGPDGTFRGIAQHQSFGTYCAQVMDIRIVQGKVKVVKVVVAIDCGMVINPNVAQAQVESAVIFGLSAALKQEITMKDGQVQQSNFHDCDALRIYETPEIEVFFVPSKEDPTGIGEPAVPPVAAALCNAIFAATGLRIKKLPIKEPIS